MAEAPQTVDPASTDWHLDKRIPVALIFAIIVQAGAGMWWAASINARVDVIESALITWRSDHEAIIRIETKVENIAASVQRLEDDRRAFAAEEKQTASIDARKTEALVRGLRRTT